MAEVIPNLPTNNVFQHPIPNIFGAFPNCSGEIPYTYSEEYFYSIPSLIKLIYYPDTNYVSQSDTGHRHILYFNKFFQNWFIYDSTTVQIRDVFPKIGSFNFNPFVNDVNGYCCWEPMTDVIARGKIYYNTSTDRYEMGFGQDYPYYYNMAYNVAIKDHGFTSIDYYNVYPVYKSDDQSTHFSISGAQKYSNPVSYKFINTTSGIPATGYIDLKNLSGVIPSGNVMTKFTTDLPSGFSSQTISSTIQLNTNGSYFRKTDILPDLDNGTSGYLGIYIHNITPYQNRYEYTSVGSIVIGSEDVPDFGKFIGWTYEFQPDDRLRTNLIKMKPLSMEINPAQNVNINWYNNVAWWMGSTYDLNSPKHIVKIKHSDHSDPYIANRVFILEGNTKDPTNYRQFYYWDPPAPQYPTSNHWPKIFCRKY